jgi:hypothetical protein
MQRAQHQVDPRDPDALGHQPLRQTLHQRTHVGGVPGLAHQPVHQRIAVLVGVGDRFQRSLVVSLVPGIHAVAVEGDVATDRLGLGKRLLVGPDRVLRHAACYAHGPVGGVSLEWAVGAMLAGLQQVHAHVRLRQVMHRRMPGLVKDQRPIAVGDANAVEAHLHAIGRGLDGDAVAGLFHSGSLDARGAVRLQPDRTGG